MSSPPVNTTSSAYATPATITNAAAAAAPAPVAVAPAAASQVLLVTASYDRTLRFWEALSGICSRTLQHPDSQVNRLALSADKKWLAAAGNPNCRLYEALTQNPSPVLSLEGHQTNVTGVQFNQQSRWLVTCSEDKTVRLFDLRTKPSTTQAQRVYRHRHPVNDVFIHPNQAEVFSCDQGGHIRVWDLTSDQCTLELTPEEDANMISVGVGSDARLLMAGGHAGRVYLWRMANASRTVMVPSTTGAASEGFKLDTTTKQQPQQQPDLQPVAKIQAHKQYLLRAVLSPDVRHLATVSADTTIRVWSIDPVTDVPAPAPPIPSSADLQSSSDYQVKLEKTLTGHTKWVWDCAWSADSEYLVSASSDNTSKLWDRRSGEAIRTYQGHNKAAICVSLNDYHL